MVKGYQSWWQVKEERKQGKGIEAKERRKRWKGVYGMGENKKNRAKSIMTRGESTRSERGLGVGITRERPRCESRVLSNGFPKTGSLQTTPFPTRERMSMARHRERRNTLEQKSETRNYLRERRFKKRGLWT